MKRTLKILRASLLVATTLVFASVSTADALSPKQLNALYSGAQWIDTDQNNNCQPGTASIPTSSGSRVYILGDSITNGARSNVQTAMSEAGFTIAALNADPGRAIASDTSPPGSSGLEAVAQDSTISSGQTESIIGGSDVAVIALGTNSGVEDLNVQIPALISAIRAANQAIRIYWVNLFYTSGTSLSARNQSISSLANGQNYSIIDTTNAGIELLEDGEHPTEAGNITFAETIVQGLGNTTVQSTTTGVNTDPCVCTTSGSGTGAFAPINPNITWGEGVWASGSEMYRSGLSGPYTIEQWAVHVLKNISRKSGVPESIMVTPNKVISLVAWAKAEGGGVDNHNGAFNPLNTKSVYSDEVGGTLPASSVDNNSTDYASFDQGVEAITRSLFNTRQKRIGSTLLTDNFTPDSLIQVKAGDFYSTDGVNVINRREDIWPGEGIFAAASVTGLVHGAPFNNGVGDRELYIEATSGSLNSVLEDYAAYAGKVLDGSPPGTPAALEYSVANGAASGGSSSGGCASSDGASNFIDGFPVYKQNDPRWGSLPYGAGINANGDERTIASSGCGPSAMAMIITALTGQTVTPADTAAFGMRPESITYASTGGSDGVRLATLMAPHWGLNATHLGANKEAINNTLRSGGLVLVSGRGGLPFSPGGHFVVIRAVTQNGMWLVGDSSHNSVRPDTSTVEYDPDVMISEFTAGGYSSFAITK